ncbi:MAG: adenosylcobinamide-GDP ribazoletransferase [Candidatus Bathyarchaeota archaeon]|nr:adenosylcobinamide-GDP ribazoletransferase [Candidatus Bathyarchaeota archaeon]
MSKMKAIKTFRDLLSFLTVIPLGKTEDFIVTAAEAIFLFPVAGAFIGLLGAAYFVGCSYLTSHLFVFANNIIPYTPVEFLSRLVPAVMTLAFLLVLTGLQHFDGLVDLGNAAGLRNAEERRAVAHAWTVTYKGAILALFVEFIAVIGLFFLNWDFAFKALIASEVAAKLAMVTIARFGQPTHKGLGSRFLSKAKQKRTVAAYFLAVIIVLPLFGFTSFGLVLSAGIILTSVLLGALMVRVAKNVFGGVSGDAIGATNEIVRAASLVFAAGVLMV